MRHPGRNNIKGIDFQILSAFSLFLQYLKIPEFSYIHLEAPDLSDFNLVFREGYKIICQAKNYSNNLQDNHIRKILDGVIKSKVVNDHDEILIICKRYKTKTFEDVKYYKYAPKEFTKVFKERGYSEDHIFLLPKMKLWKSDEKTLVEIIFSLLYELIGFWIPDRYIERIINDILYEKFLKGSSAGLVFSREDILNEIKSIAGEVKRSSTIFNEELNPLNDQISNIITSVEEGKPKYGHSDLGVLTQKPNLMYLLLNRLKQKANLKLVNWDSVLKASEISVYIYILFDLFKNNLSDKSNRNYILDFIIEEIDKLNTYYRDNFFIHNASEILIKILNKDPESYFKIFTIIKKQFDIYGKDVFYIELKRNMFHKIQDISKAIKILFEKSEEELKLEIFKFILDTFNLIADSDEEHNHYTPEIIFGILRYYLTYDNNKFFKNRFLDLKSDLVKQFEKYEIFYAKKGYDGWDHIGSFGTFWGNNYRVFDKCFIKRILISSLYNLDENDRWKFVKNNCIFKDSEVNKSNPDFLNRTAIPITLDEFRKGNKEADNIIERFINSKQGIPNKQDLIYQYVCNDGFSDGEKWYLIGLSLRKSKLPMSPFIEIIIADLAKNGNLNAQSQLEKWYEDPNYFKMHRTSIDRSNIIENINKLLESSPPRAIELFRNIVLDEDFINSIDNFDINNYTDTLSRIIKADIKIGIGILKEIYNRKQLSENQQLLICYSINNISEEREKLVENKEILIAVYKKFLKPILLELNNIANIEDKFSYMHARESIVKFAEKLAIICEFDEALFIVNKFIFDSDPPIDGTNYPDDPKGDFNYHLKVMQGEDLITINTVRGWCSWVLQKFTCLKGRKYIPKIIPLVYKLLNDDNYYVRVQACVPLIELVKSRHNMMPSKSKERFLDIKTAEKIDTIAFKVLENEENQKLKYLMIYLAKVFNFMLSLNEGQAKKVFDTFLNLKDKIICEKTSEDVFGKRNSENLSAYEDILIEILPTLVYYAEYRRNAIKDGKYKYVYLNKWNDLKNFEDKPFKKMLIDLIINGSSGIKSSLAWHFYDAANLFPNDFKIYYKYINILADNYDHNTFENIYHFIEKNIYSNFDECIELWKKCIKNEREFIKSNFKENNKIDMYWWPYFYNGKILKIILDKEGKKEFLKWFEFLLDYPEEILIANDLDIAISCLNEFPKDNKKAKDIYKKIVERNPSKYFDNMSEWLK